METENKCNHNWVEWNEDNEGVVYWCNRCDATKSPSIIDKLKRRDQDRLNNEAQEDPREGICHCGYPCDYGTGYCNRHQIP